MANNKIILIGGNADIGLHAAVRAIEMKIDKAVLVVDNNQFKPEPIVYEAHHVPKLINRTVIQPGGQSRRERRKQ